MNKIQSKTANSRHNAMTFRELFKAAAVELPGKSLAELIAVVEARFYEQRYDETTRRHVYVHIHGGKAKPYAVTTYETWIHGSHPPVVGEPDLWPERRRGRSIAVQAKAGTVNVIDINGRLEGIEKALKDLAQLIIDRGPSDAE